MLLQSIHVKISRGQALDSFIKPWVKYMCCIHFRDINTIGHTQAPQKRVHFQESRPEVNGQFSRQNHFLQMDIRRDFTFHMCSMIFPHKNIPKGSLPGPLRAQAFNISAVLVICVGQEFWMA